MKRIYATVCIAGFLAGCSTDRALDRGLAASSVQSVSGSGSSVADLDAEFAQAICQSTITKLEMGRLALRNSRSPEVRRLGRMLVDEHTESRSDLCRLLARKGIEGNMELTFDRQMALEKLASLDGEEFDRAFKEQVIRNHETAIELFEKLRCDGSDADLKRFAERTLPQLCEELTAARAGDL